MPLEPSLVLARLRSLAPFEDDVVAGRALEATLKALRGALSDDEADWLALDLGPALASALHGPGQASDLSLDQFQRAVARFAGLRRSEAKERAQLVCRVLTELLSESTIARVRRCLPQLDSLFTRPAPERPALGPHRLRADPGPERTLAGGRPGAARPLCEAQSVGEAMAPGGSAARTHVHSVAASNDPHGDTKLSSAHGLSQERAHRSLATAEPARRTPR